MATAGSTSPASYHRSLLYQLCLLGRISRHGYSGKIFGMTHEVSRPRLAAPASTCPSRGHSGFPDVPLVADALRLHQARFLEWLGFSAVEHPYEVIYEGPHYRLRKYGGASGLPVLIVAAPIKRPYIWDLSPRASAIGCCLRHRLRPYLLEWRAPTPGALCGLADYAGRFIRDAMTHVSADAGGSEPILMGHSLGGTLAAIAASCDSRSIRGLVLLASPLCFAPGSSSFRDAVAAVGPPLIADKAVVPGSLLSHFSAMASPQAFIWSRLADAVASADDAEAFKTHMRVERWTLDEFPLSGPLTRDISSLLYRTNEFCRGSLSIAGCSVGPSCIQVPTLAVVNAEDVIAPRASVAPVMDGIPFGTLIEHAGEHGVGLQHVAILVGGAAQHRTWPQVLAWIDHHA